MGEDFIKIASRYARKSGRGVHSYGKYIALIREDKYTPSYDLFSDADNFLADCLGGFGHRL